MSPPSVSASPERTELHGVLGRAYIDLEPFVDLAPLDAIHEEVCLALAQLPVDYTGGSHRSMGIMPQGYESEALVDYGEIIEGLLADAFATFRELADDPAAIDASRESHQTFGEERDVLLSRRQMLWLKVRFGVYFPWKAYVELMPNRSWSDKSSAAGKAFTARAKAFLPKTVAYVQTLPFREIGRCNIMGLEGSDHGTVHRDGDPSEKPEVDHFIVLCPAKNKRLYLLEPELNRKTYIDRRAYWFNDSDYHGVDADPFFRYSIRVDGIFEPSFLERIARP
ncbi:MAG: hypothetical protein IPG50_03635 [Myxococcales bacterium]|nr:hypothetical protein [Myxococcales bacterium]